MSEDFKGCRRWRCPTWGSTSWLRKRMLSTKMDNPLNPSPMLYTQEGLRNVMTVLSHLSNSGMLMKSTYAILQSNIRWNHVTSLHEEIICWWSQRMPSHLFCQSWRDQPAQNFSWYFSCDKPVASSGTGYLTARWNHEQLVLEEEAMQLRRKLVAITSCGILIVK